jgi:hypothetical protein
MALLHQLPKLICDNLLVVDRWWLIGEGVDTSCCLLCFCVLFVAGYYVMAQLVVRRRLAFEVWLVVIIHKWSLEVLQVGFGRLN